MNLHIIEISGLIHSGAVNTRVSIKGPLLATPSGFREKEIPSGGIAFLFNKIFQHENDGLIVFVADRAPTYKMALYPEYKANREDNPSIDIQKIVVEEILEDCGYQVIWEEGAEADDGVYSLVCTYRDDFDKIYVHTGDGDLYICVDDTTEILPVNSRGKHLTKKDYSSKAMSDRVIPYNAMSIELMIKGKAANNVPPLKMPDVAKKLRTGLYTPFLLPRLGKRALVKSLIERVAPEALTQFELTYPREIDVTLDFKRKPDPHRTAQWARVVGNSLFKKVTVSAEVEHIVESFFERALSVE